MALKSVCHRVLICHTVPKELPAAKARIRRMIAEKKRRSDLCAPAMVKEQWEKGTKEKDEMAQLLQDTNWDKERGSGHSIT